MKRHTPRKTPRKHKHTSSEQANERSGLGRVTYSRHAPSRPMTSPTGFAPGMHMGQDKLTSTSKIGKSNTD